MVLLMLAAACWGVLQLTVTAGPGSAFWLEPAAEAVESGYAVRR